MKTFRSIEQIQARAARQRLDGPKMDIAFNPTRHAPKPARQKKAAKS